MRKIAWCLLLSLAFGGWLPDRAECQTLTGTSLKGSYGFRFSATIVPRLDGVTTVTTPAPFAASGVFTADGNGTISAGSITYNYDGVVCSTTIAAGSQLAGSIYTVEPDGEAAILLVMPTDDATCGVTSLFFAGALDEISAAGVALQVQLTNTAVVAVRLGTTAFSAPTDIAVVGAGEARLQASTAVRPLPCAIFGRC